MASAMLPFNVELLKLADKDLQNLRPVTSLDYFENANGNLHPDGLFSTEIFGRIGDEVRDRKFSYIDLGTTILHPAVWKILVQLKSLYQGIASRALYATWDEKQKDFVAANELTGETGYAFFMKHWKKIDYHRTKSTLRDARIKVLDKYKDIAEINRVLVLPAGLRDIEQGDDGRPVVGEVNTYYRKLIAVSRTIVDTHSSDPSILDLPRFVLQQTYNEVYDYFTNLLSGKKGFVQRRWGARRIASGTRNVISSMNASSALLGGRRAPKFDDTIVGLFEGLVSILPVAVFQLKNKYVGPIFSYGNGQAKLVDPKTLKGVVTDVSVTEFDRWTTNEGVERVINGYRDLDRRKKPVKVDNFYLALIYRGPDKTFRIFSGIEELPKGFDRKYVHPIDYTELLYLSGYEVWNTFYGFVTRYPITGTGSIFPSSMYIKTTTQGEERRELGEDWLPLKGDRFEALEFPRADLHTFVDSLVIASVRLAGLGADFSNSP